MYSFFALPRPEAGRLRLRRGTAPHGGKRTPGSLRIGDPEQENGLPAPARPFLPRTFVRTRTFRTVAHETLYVPKTVCVRRKSTLPERPVPFGFPAGRALQRLRPSASGVMRPREILPCPEHFPAEGLHLRPDRPYPLSGPNARRGPIPKRSGAKRQNVFPRFAPPRSMPTD